MRLAEGYNLDNLQPYLSDLDDLYNGLESRIIKDFGHTKTAVIRFDLGRGRESFFLKKCGSKGITSRVLQAFRKSKASKAWAMSLRFLEKGIPVTKPVALIETRRNGLKGESYFLSLFAEDAVNLKAHVNRIGMGFLENGQLLRRIGDAIGRMHRSGCLHGDLKWSNLIVSDPAGDPRPLFVDLEHGRCGRSTTDQERAKDLARFMVDAEETNITLHLSKLFLKAYFEASGIRSSRKDSFITQMEKHARKIRLRHEKNINRS